MRTIVAFVLLVIGTAACSKPSSTRSGQGPASSPPSLETRAWNAIKAGAMVLDVRTPQEFAAGHLEGAINIPHDRIRERAAELGADTERTIVVYCRSGVRAETAEGALRGLGFENVINARSYEAMARAQRTN